MIDVEKIQSMVSRHQPVILDVDSVQGSRAVVALIMDCKPSSRDPAIVFIERARQAEDPWSGQIAFPGGHCESDDKHPVDTAIRETHEEIGIDLLTAQYFGRLDDLHGRHGSRSSEMVISCFVYSINSSKQFFPNHEVADVFTLPFSKLLDPTKRVELQRVQPNKVFPGIRIGGEGRVVWGLTYRFLAQFFRILGYSLPTD